MLHITQLTNSSMSLSISNGMQRMSGKRALPMDHAISALVKLVACNHAHVLNCCILHLHVYHHSCVSYSRLIFSQTDQWPAGHRRVFHLHVEYHSLFRIHV